MKTFNLYYSKSNKMPFVVVPETEETFVAKGIVCQVPTWGVYGEGQPSWFLRGRAKKIRIINDIIVIT